MDLNELRLEIDKIDQELVRLFVQRMEVSARIADYKKQHGLPIFVPTREAEKLSDVAQMAGEDMEIYTKVLYSMLFELSRGYQSQRNATRTDLFGRITEAIERTDKLLPKNVPVAILTDTTGTNSMVCRKLFGDCPTVPFKTVDGILAAVTQGLCRYGVIPVEGNIHKIYDQLASQSLTIMRAFRLSEQTAYICVSRELEIYPGSHRTSLCLALSDKPGALYKVLARLYTLGINVVRLESRTMERRHFQGMFYFDLETSVYSEEFVQLICELGDLCEEFAYLGSYTEVV